MATTAVCIDLANVNQVVVPSIQNGKAQFESSLATQDQLKHSLHANSVISDMCMDYMCMDYIQYLQTHMCYVGKKQP